MNSTHAILFEYFMHLIPLDTTPVNNIQRRIGLNNEHGNLARAPTKQGKVPQGPIQAKKVPKTKTHN